MSLENKFTRLPKLARLVQGREWVYFLRADCEARLVKIGHSINLKWRLMSLQTQSPVQLNLIGLVHAPAGTEFVIHEALDASRSHGEWFRPTDDLETVRKALPRAGGIETPQLVEIAALVGLAESRVIEILVWSLGTQKHLGKAEQHKLGRRPDRFKIENALLPLAEDLRKRALERFGR